MRILLSLLLLLPLLTITSANAVASFLELLPGQPETDHDKYFLCYRPWVAQCSLVRVEWTPLENITTLDFLGATFVRSAGSSMDHSPLHRLSMVHLAGPEPADMLFLQVWGRGERKELHLHATLGGARFMVSPCRAKDCHLLLTLASGWGAE